MSDRELLDSNNPAGSSPDSPLYFRWVADENGVKWGNVLLALALSVITGYLSVQAQRAASDADFNRTLRMAVARKRITLGTRIQQAGRSVEEAGWAAYELARG